MTQTKPSDDAAAIANEFKDYAYSVSHDLSAPVRAMVEFSRLLTSEHANELTEEGRQFLSLIITSGWRLQSMMDGLLAYSRLNTMAKPMVPVEAERIARDCCLAMEQQLLAAKAGVEIGPLPTLYADVDQFMQLFHLLLDNALKFQPPGNAPRIAIQAEQKGEYWQFSVRDNGIGIAPQFQQKIFKLFQRLHTDEEYPGVGVGLTLAQKIVTRHGGNIWCESEPGKPGTVFYFTIPASTSG